MGSARKRRAQISLEFLFIFGVFMIMLVYSLQVVTFAKNSPSVDALRIQVALEEKGLANALSSAVS